MSDALNDQLAFLRQQRDSATDPQIRAQFEQLLMLLQAQSASQQIAGQSAVGNAIQGNVSGDVTNVAGDQQTINTGGGDYAERDIDKRQGTFYEAAIQVFFQAAGVAHPTEAQRELLFSPKL